MKTFDFIPPTANAPLRGEQDQAVLSSGHAQSSEPFDQLMTRALSPSKVDAAVAKSRGDANAASLSGGKINNAVTSYRQRVQGRNAENKDALPVADSTQDSALKPAGKKTGAQSADNNVPSTSADPSQILAADLSGVIVPLVATLPVSVVSKLMPLTGKTNPSPVEDAAASLSIAAVKSSKDGSKVLADRNETKGSSPAAVTAANPETGASQTSAQLIRSLKPDAPKAIVAETKNVACDTTRTVEASADQLPAGELKISEISGSDLAMAKSIAETTAHLPQNGIPNTAVLKTEVSAALPIEGDGTAAAKLYLPMNKTEKMIKAAGAMEKVLPGNTSLVAKENILPANFSHSGQDAGRADEGTKDSGTAEATSAITASARLDLSSRAIERAHDIIAVQASRLGDSGLDSLHVVIKPGAGMQLSLDLRQRGDAIDAQVVLDHGDFGVLKQHWPELQQRLEERGVRLAPLTGSENSTLASGDNGFQQPRHREFINPEPIEAGAFADYALAQSNLKPFTPSTTAASTAHGWETWA